MAHLLPGLKEFHFREEPARLVAGAEGSVGGPSWSRASVQGSQA